MSIPQNSETLDHAIVESLTHLKLSFPKFKRLEADVKVYLKALDAFQEANTKFCGVLDAFSQVAAEGPEPIHEISDGLALAARTISRIHDQYAFQADCLEDELVGSLDVLLKEGSKRQAELDKSYKDEKKTALGELGKQEKLLKKMEKKHGSAHALNVHTSVLEQQNAVEESQGDVETVLQQTHKQIIEEEIERFDMVMQCLVNFIKLNKEGADTTREATRVFLKKWDVFEDDDDENGSEAKGDTAEHTDESESGEGEGDEDGADDFERKGDVVSYHEPQSPQLFRAGDKDSLPHPNQLSLTRFKENEGQIMNTKKTRNHLPIGAKPLFPMPGNEDPSKGFQRFTSNQAHMDDSNRPTLNRDLDEDDGEDGYVNRAAIRQQKGEKKKDKKDKKDKKGGKKKSKKDEDEDEDEPDYDDARVKRGLRTEPSMPAKGKKRDKKKNKKKKAGRSSTEATDDEDWDAGDSDDVDGRGKKGKTKREKSKKKKTTKKTSPTRGDDVDRQPQHHHRSHKRMMDSLMRHSRSTEDVRYAAEADMRRDGRYDDRRDMRFYGNEDRARGHGGMDPREGMGRYPRDIYPYDDRARGYGYDVDYRDGRDRVQRGPRPVSHYGIEWNYTPRKGEQSYYRPRFDNSYHPGRPSADDYAVRAGMLPRREGGNGRGSYLPQPFGPPPTGPPTSQPIAPPFYDGNDRPPRNPGAGGRRLGPNEYRVLYAYRPTEQTQLELAVGDVVRTSGDPDQNWQYGFNYRNQKSGWFPRTYLDFSNDRDAVDRLRRHRELPASSHRMTGNAPRIPPPDY